MITQKEREYMEGLILELSDAERNVFSELLIFIRDNDGASKLLEPAGEAGCKSWGEAFAYILDNYEREPSTSIQ